MEHSSHIVKTGQGYMLTFEVLMYIEGNEQTSRPILELCHRSPDILERVLNLIALSNSTVRKCAPMQVMKQQEHGRTSRTKGQK